MNDGDEVVSLRMFYLNLEGKSFFRFDNSMVLCYLDIRDIYNVTMQGQGSVREIL